MKKTKRILNTLNNCIDELCRSPQNFLADPEKDFTRRRKLCLEKVIRVLLSMQNKSLSHELLDLFEFDTSTPTASAFVQQRSKIKASAFEHIFKSFTNAADIKYETYRGFRLLAVGSSCVGSSCVGSSCVGSSCVGFDISACIPESVTILPNETKLISSGFSIALPHGYGAFIFARSGLGIKKGIVPANCVGVIDSDYRGEVMVGLKNTSNEPFVVNSGDRIAQMVILQCELPTFTVCDSLDETERGSNGFGSTNI